MEYRKLIKFGNSSHVISIPKGWIKKNDLKKGDHIYLEENGNSELILAPRENDGEGEEKEVTINLDGMDFDEIKRQLYSKYIAGYDVINLLGKKEIKENENELRLALSKMTALEVIEHTKNKVVVKDFINTRAISIEGIIRRIDILIRSMLDELKITYKDDSYSFTRRDQDINKLSNLALRTLKKAAEKPNIQKKIGIDNKSSLKMWDIINYLEHFGDELKRAARYLGSSKANKDLMDRFFEIAEKVGENYKNIMKARHNNDEALAYEVARNSENIIDQLNKLVKPNSDISFSHAVVRLKTMEVFIKRIARTVYQ